MASFKSYPIFYSVIVVLGLVVVAEGWGIYDRSATASKSAKVLTQKQTELISLRSSNPVPTPENKAAVEADLARTEIALGKMREELKGRGETVTKLRTATAPTDPTGMFFDITAFVEKNRERAEAAKVKIKSDERFGFTTYANAGPDRDLIPQVFLQRQITEYLVDALFEARPVELISVQRERPKTQAERAAQASPDAGGGVVAPVSNSANSSAVAANNDLFEIDRRISARVPGFVDATAFRLTFVGGTPVLRSVLNKLATFELPLVVRSVEVEPITAQQAQAAAPAPATLASIFGTAPSATPEAPAAPKPLVEKVLSKFTVTVELIDLVEAPKTP